MLELILKPLHNIDSELQTQTLKLSIGYGVDMEPNNDGG